MDFSVIIPTYKRKNSLLSLLNFLKDSINQIDISIKGEIIVVEQMPFVFSEEEIFLKKKELPFLRWIKIEKANLPLARDIGILLSQGEIIIFLDDDLEIGNGFLGAYLDFFQKTEENVVVVTGRLIQPNLKGFYSVLEKIPPFFSPFSKMIYGGFNLNKTRLVQTVKGCNVAFRRKILLEIGGFDPNFEVVALREEADVIERLKKKGYKVFYIPQAKAIHQQVKEGGERQRDYSELLYWGRRSESLFITKNFSLPVWFGFYFRGLLVAFLRGLTVLHPFIYSVKAHQGMLEGRRISHKAKNINFLDYVKNNIKWMEI